MVLMSAVAMIALVSIFVSTQKKAKSTDQFEFELDSEKCPTPKENKKAMKKTLKNIMSKNGAKTSLIN